MINQTIQQQKFIFKASYLRFQLILCSKYSGQQFMMEFTSYRIDHQKGRMKQSRKQVSDEFMFASDQQNNQYKIQ
ncbi:hypothetical protein pb186bvf_001724 [Paramecium bursaria]